MTNAQKQRQLQFLGFYAGKIDGLWGAQSVAATRAFQQANGLVVDGKFGAKTEAKTMQLVIDIQRQIGANVDGLVGSETIAKYNAWKKKQATSDSKTSDASGDWWSEIKYFKRSEFACKCGGKYCNGYPVEMQKGVVKLAYKARAHFNAPAYVISGIRCERHNANEGGVSGSRHKLGKAIDLRIKGVSSAKLLAFMQKQPEVRYTYAINDTNVHFDIQ